MANPGYSPLKNFLFCCVSENRTLNFADTIRHALELAVSDKIDSLIAALPESFDYDRKNIPNVTKKSMEEIRGSGLGFYTFRFNQIFGSPDDIFFCRSEALRRDLLAFFDGIGATSDALRAYIMREEKKNISNHAHYSRYYTPALAELVSIRDRPVIDRFDFRFEKEG
jgi:hypothetical protein